MGDEIEKTDFTDADFETFQARLRDETRLLREHLDDRGLSVRGPICGFELEAWLIDDQGRASPTNREYLARLDSPLVVPELAQFNVELNGSPTALQGHAFTRLQDELTTTFEQCRACASAMDLDLAIIGILPSVGHAQLTEAYMSNMARYRALNQQILAQRDGRPLELRIDGREKLRDRHDDVMLEAAATSFQIHLQVRPDNAVALFNASVLASAPMVAASANSPYLFGRCLWEETRIPVFEQAVNVGDGAYHRVTFGQGFAVDSLYEFFEENLAHYATLIPAVHGDPDTRFSHVRFHNGTIWRWNRPLIGFDHDGTVHMRIEHRVVPAGPTIVDSIANAALYFGLVHFLAAQGDPVTAHYPFEQVKADFYSAARLGLEAQITWLDGKQYPLQSLFTHVLLPGARQALADLAIPQDEIDRYLDIVEGRIASGRTGAAWQRNWVKRHGPDMEGLVKAYVERQKTGTPVHEWDVE